MPSNCRNLILVLGDQLNLDSAAFDDFDPSADKAWMAEVTEESTHVWTHKARIVVFLAAMRHFCKSLQEQGIHVLYRFLLDDQNQHSLIKELDATLKELAPERVVIVQPGEWRVQQQIAETVAKHKIDLEIRSDRHFFCSPQEFAEHAKGRKQLRQEYFYRELRRTHDILMEEGEPTGGKWNYDVSNRNTFGKDGPQATIEFERILPDNITKEVIDLVESTFTDHPGSLEHFDWPVTPDQAQRVLRDFVENRLPNFGDYQDAMWTAQPFLYHSRLSAALNLKLIDPRDVIAAAIDAYHAGQVPLNCVEGFVRQILGWREYVRGIYWHFMPKYLKKNYFSAKQPLPEFYWTGETEMNCLHHVIGQTLDYGYAHHIQRLMVTGLFSLLLGVDPKQVHEWYLAVYVDAVEWVELPNSLGMSQFADGGIMASKPYIATGKYIKRMSNYCTSCRYNPDKATGDDACPFTTLYWDFLARHRDQLSTNRRIVLQLKNLDRKDQDEVELIRQQAEQLRELLVQ